MKIKSRHAFVAVRPGEDIIGVDLGPLKHAKVCYFCILNGEQRGHAGWVDLRSLTVGSEEIVGNIFLSVLKGGDADIIIRSHLPASMSSPL